MGEQRIFTVAMCSASCSALDMYVIFVVEVDEHLRPTRIKIVKSEHVTRSRSQEIVFKTFFLPNVYRNS